MHRGKLVILAIAASALFLAGYSWWHRYQQGRRCLNRFGTENALLIRHAPRVELLTLADGAQPADSHETPGSHLAPRDEALHLAERDGYKTLTVDGQEIAILKREDLSRARGLVHARHVLIEDASFDWDRSADGCGGEWNYAFRFSDGEKSVHLVFDFHCGRAILLENKADVRLVPRVKEALAKYIREHSKETLPHDETTRKTQ